MNEELNNALAQAICDPVCPVQYSPVLMEVKRTIGKQDAEIERLRAALKSIAYMPGTGGAVNMVAQMTGIAVAALYNQQAPQAKT